jgi:hypothetical protein
MILIERSVDLYTGIEKTMICKCSVTDYEKIQVQAFKLLLVNKKNGVNHTPFFENIKQKSDHETLMRLAGLL